MTACGIGEIIDLRLVDLYPLAYKNFCANFWRQLVQCRLL